MHSGERVHSWGNRELLAGRNVEPFSSLWVDWQMRNQGTPSTPGVGGWGGERKGEVNEKGGNLLILSFLRPFPPWKKTQRRGYHLTQDLQVLSVWLWRSNNAAATCAHTHKMKKTERVRVLFQGGKKGFECAGHLLKWAHRQYEGFQEFQVINLSNLYSCQPRGREVEEWMGGGRCLISALWFFCRKMLRPRHQRNISPIAME